GGLERMRAERYGGWRTPEARAMLAGSLEDAAAPVLGGRVDPRPRSGRQERLEAWVNRFV
ncbi:MAG: xylose isomerase, partial [Pseudomonadota bacterium]